MVSGEDAKPKRLIADPVEFWEERHVRLDPWRAGGDRGLSRVENYEFYAYRLGRIIELIRRYAGGERPLRILDAGCGRGHLADGLHRCGHRVVGVDSSSTAIAYAREYYQAEFAESDLTALRVGEFFDVVVCIDVLFHLVDEGAWRRALSALARHASAEALFVLTDAFPEEPFSLGDYIVHRARRDYDAVLESLDFHLAELKPYAFGSNPNAFAAYVRAI